MLKAYFPLLLSHHPDCDSFSEDVFTVRGVKFCVGCSVAYPIAIFIFILWLAGAFSPNNWPYYLLFGVLSGSVELLSLKGFTTIRNRKAVVKFFLGIGWGLTTIGVFSLPVDILLRIVIFFDLFMANAALTMKRSGNIDKICENCPWFKHRGIDCPGFAKYNLRMQKIIEKESEKEPDIVKEMMMLNKIQLNKKALRKDYYRRSRRN